MQNQDGNSAIKKNIYQRFIEVQKKVLSVQKNEEVKMSERDKGYKAVNHDDVAAALHLPLAEAGIMMLPKVTKYSFSEFLVEKQSNSGKYQQKWYRTDIEIDVQWINADEPSDFFTSNGAAYAVDTSDKSFAKAYSLALKIVLLKVHLLESRDEEEKRLLENETKKMSPIDQQPKQKKQDLVFASDALLNKMYDLMTARGVTEMAMNLLLFEGFKIKSMQIPEPIVMKIIKYLSDERSNENGIIAYAEKCNGSPLALAGDFIMPFGAETKGKKISEIKDTKLIEIFKWTEKVLADKGAPNIQETLRLHYAIKEYLESLTYEMGAENVKS